MGSASCPSSVRVSIWGGGPPAPTVYQICYGGSTGSRFGDRITARMESPHMKLKSIKIENFKNIESITLDLHPEITALIGRNNVGKSSILQAADLLGGLCSSSTRFSLPDAFVRWVRGGDTNLQMLIDIELILSEADARKAYSENLAARVATGEIRPFVRARLRSGGSGALETGLRVGEGEQALEQALPMQSGANTSFGIDHILDAGGIEAIGGVTIDYAPLARTLAGIGFLSAGRASQGDAPPKGVERLAEDASNLTQFLLSLLSRDPPSYNEIVRGLRQLVPEVHDLLAPLRENAVVIELYDRAYPNVQMDWENVSTGTRQLIHLLAFAASTQVMLIEEPELSLHQSAVAGLIDILNLMCKGGGKQLICASHSPALINELDLDQVRLVGRKGVSPTYAKSLGEFRGIERRIRETGLSLGPLLGASGRPEGSPRLLLIVEGRDDLLVWKAILLASELSDDEGLRIQKADGWKGACSMAQFVSLLGEIGIHSVDYLVVLDSDGRRDERLNEVSQYGLDLDRCFVLAEKELESYLIDAEALARVTGKDQAWVRDVISSIKGRGKEKLRTILGKAGLQPDAGVFQALVLNMSELPGELSDVVERIRSTLNDK